MSITLSIPTTASIAFGGASKPVGEGEEDNGFEEVWEEEDDDNDDDVDDVDDVVVVIDAGDEKIPSFVCLLSGSSVD